jgi:hypothetical protein
LHESPLASIEIAIPHAAKTNGSKRLNPESTIDVKSAAVHRERRRIAQNDADVTWRQVESDCFTNV